MNKDRKRERETVPNKNQQKKNRRTRNGKTGAAR